MMDLNDYYTLNQIEEKYNITTSTLRSYINRKRIIPQDKIKKLDRIWLIEKEWVDEMYKDKIRKA